MSFERYCPNCDKQVEPETDKCEIQTHTGHSFDVRVEWCEECGHVFAAGTWVE